MTATLLKNTRTAVKDPFVVFAEAIQAHFDQLSKQELYVVDSPELWDVYLAAFPAGTNENFRTQASHDCRYCRSFVRGLGNVVAIQNNQLVSVWDCTGLAEPYATVAAALSAAVKAGSVNSVFRSVEPSYGRLPNVDAHDPRITWSHLYGKVASRHVGDGAKRGYQNDSQTSLQKGLEEFSVENLTEVIDVIGDCNGIYRGQEFLPKLKEFRTLAQAYLTAPNQALFSWEHASSKVARLRGEVIGTLLSDLAAGKSLDEAERAFGSKMDPRNYKRSATLITPRQVDTALATLRSLDLESALERRYARLGDVSVNDVRWVNNDASAKMQDPLRALLVGQVKQPVTVKTSSTLDIEQLLALRPAKLELLLKPEHFSRFVSLTAAVHPEVNPLFKWANHFGWSYDGDVTDSIKERVAKAGGNVLAKLRCSLGWYNTDDLDIHCYGPQGHIFYGRRQGILDVDMNRPGSTLVRNPVENLSWVNLVDGTYDIHVRNFQKRESADVGFELQVEFEGNVTNYAYPRALLNQTEVPVLTLKVKDQKLVSVTTHAGVVAGEQLVIEKWGVKTNTPIAVDTVMCSPNYWENSSKTGNQHWFFFLKGCVNPEPTRGIYNEFLRSDLEPHRKVFEVLGSKTKCPWTENQLSGIGFSTTQKASIQVLVDSRPYELQFS